VDNKGGLEENAVVEGSWGGVGGYFWRHCCSPSSSSRVASGNFAPHPEPPKILARILPATLILRLPPSSSRREGGWQWGWQRDGKEDGNYNMRGFA